MLTRSCLLAGLLLAAAGPATSASPAYLETETLRLSWPAGSAVPDQWRVLAGQHNGRAQWRSLVSETAHGTALSRHLAVNGLDIGNWHAQVVDPVTVVLTGHTPDGSLVVRQQFTGTSDYRLQWSLEVRNLADQGADLDGLQLQLGPGLGEQPVDGLGMATGLYSFVEAIALVDGRVHRPDAPEPGVKGVLEDLARPNWLGLYSRYFALLVQPGQPGDIHAVALSLPAEDTDLPARYLPSLILDLDAGILPAGETRRWEFEVFSGPRSRDAASAGDSDFSGMLFPGLWEWMRLLCFGLLWLLELLFALMPSWGLAIIVLAVLVRLAMYPLARRALAGQHAFAEVQRKIQPEIREIKKNYKGGEQSERILKLYEHHNVSPLAGLKPLLIVLVQIPVFVALFHVLGQAYELREASFLWIETLAEPDRLFGFGAELPFFGAWFNLLPVLLAVTTLLTLKLSPAPAADAATQRRQNIFLGLMAIGFFLIFYPFPSGMVLYWTTANVLHIAQSWMTGGKNSSIIQTR